ncbi:hypothetical protein A7978_05640 (plasmid) [Borrelia turicatae]|uniref:Fibronectin-binding protein n=1 Tax=Borrelia turicatae TaxID=142 RepID=A0A172XDG2_BORTU|nr:hypothetical protein [Borrelia turicatae]ANF34582.1 hypothetical protein A7978_05640 [Borrelia turicatae]UPA15753.1 hypothetical protein btBTE5EL_001476 [Borrelia turicatae]
MQKTKFLILSLLLSFISCDLLLNGELKDKSNNLLDKVYSILDFTQHNDSNNANSQNNTTNTDSISAHIDARSMPQTAHHTSSYKKNTTDIGNGIGIPHINGTSILQIDNTNKKSQDIYTPIQTDLDITPLTETVDTIIVDAYKKPLPPLNHYSESSSNNSLQGESGDSNNFEFYYDSTSRLSGQNSFIKDYYEKDDNYYNYEEKYDDTYEDEDYEVDDYHKKENEEKYDNDDYDEEEEKLDREYKLRSRNTKVSVKKALKLSEKMKDDWEKVEFHKTKLNPIYGRRPEDSEKQKSQQELYKFNKNKLTEDLKNLLSTIEESLNNAIHLTKNDEPNHLGGFQSDQQAKTKLEQIKSEISHMLSKVQKNHKDDYQIYEEIGSSKGMLPPKTKSELEQVLILLDGTTGAR